MNDPHDNAQTDKEILAKLNRELTPGRLDEIMTDAMDHFWARVGHLMPECQTGDFSLHDQLKLEDACRKAIKRWWELNHA